MTPTARLGFLLLLLGALTALSVGCGGDDDDDSTGSGTDDDDDNDDNDASPTDDDDNDNDESPDDDDDNDDDNDDDESPDDDDDDDDDNDDNDDDDTSPACDFDAYNPLIDAGKASLETRDASAAYDSFFEAQMICPDEPAGMVGLAMSDAQWILRWFQTLYESLAGFDPSPKDAKSFATVLQAMIRDSFLPVNQEMFALLDTLLADHADVEFVIATLPMWSADDAVTLDVGGAWDASDLQNLLAFTAMVEGLERLLISFDLTFNYNTYAFWPMPAGGAPLEEVVHSITGLLIALIEDPGYPNLLTFLDGGPEQFAECAIQLGFGCLDSVEAFAMVREETGGQDGEVVGYVDENTNGQWDEGEPYSLPMLGALDDEAEANLEAFLVLLADLGPALLDGGPQDLHPALPDWLPLSDLNVLIELFTGAPPTTPLPPLPIPVGRWFYDPPEDGVRTLVYQLAQILYEWSAPDQEVAQ